MKKLLALVLAAIMVLSVMSFAVAEEPIVLTIVAWDANTTGYLTAQKEAYEATHPGVVIEYIDVASQEYGTKATAMLAAEDTADLYMVKDVPGLINWHEAKYDVDMTPYIAASNYDVSGFVGMETNYNYGGVQAALPFRADYWVLFYNKTLFDNAGVAYPTNDMTWEEYKEKAIALSNADIHGTHIHTWRSAAINWTVCDGVNTLIDGEYSDLAYFYQLAQDLEDAGACIPYTELTASGLHYSGAFGNGNIAMMPMGFWYAATLIQNIKDGSYNVSDWGITAVPHKEDVQAGSSFGNPTGIMISKYSKNPDAAWDYVAWLCGEEGSQVTAATGNRPAWVSEDVATVLAGVEGFPQDENSIAALIPTYVGIELAGSPVSSTIDSIMGEEHSMIMTREISIEEGIEELTERVAEVLEQ